MASYRTDMPDTVYLPPPPHHVTTTIDIRKIRTWLPWSIINLFIGWGLGGIIPLIFSMICRQNKRNNDVNGAQTMSKLALVFNIIITIGGIAGWISLIILLVVVRRIYRM